MAPEVYDSLTKAYDPRASDIWSLAIIFCCMTLKRFPWRIPSVSQDKSFRLFSSPPSPGHNPKNLLLQSKSAADLTKQRAAAIEASPGAADDQDRGRQGGAATNGEAKHQRSRSQGANQTERREVISGPWRILKQLPRESRNIIWRMLEVDPRKRVKMEQIIRDPWVANSVICRETDTGQVISALGHTHTLIEANGLPATAKNDTAKKNPA